MNDYQNCMNGIGKLGKPYRIEIVKNAEPILNPYRKVPYALEKHFKKYLHDLIKLCII